MTTIARFALSQYNVQRSQIAELRPTLDPGLADQS
jgi:hypothetical protein